MSREHNKTPEEQHFNSIWWEKSFCRMLADRAALGHRLRRLVLHGRTCHVVAGDIVGAEPVNSLESLELGELEEWVDEVVDERDDCGMEAGYYADCSWDD